jgi:hypothetical protein
LLGKVGGNIAYSLYIYNNHSVLDNKADTTEILHYMEYILPFSIPSFTHPIDLIPLLWRTSRALHTILLSRIHSQDAVVIWLKSQSTGIMIA